MLSYNPKRDSIEGTESITFFVPNDSPSIGSGAVSPLQSRSLFYTLTALVIITLMIWNIL